MRGDAAQAHTTIQVGAVRVSFYVREPSPDRWNAIGVVSFDGEESRPCTSATCRMIVGSGTSRDEAIGDLIARVLTGQHPHLQQARTMPPLTDPVATSMRT